MYCVSIILTYPTQINAPPKTIDVTAHHIHVRVPIQQFNPIQPTVIVDDILASVIKIHSIQITKRLASK